MCMRARVPRQEGHDEREGGEQEEVGHAAELQPGLLVDRGCGRVRVLLGEVEETHPRPPMRGAPPGGASTGGDSLTGQVFRMDAHYTTPPGGHAAVYDAVMWPFERAAVGAWRRRLAAAAHGRVLEIGSGTGAQLRWYAPGAEVTALEPDEGMRARLTARAGRVRAAVTVVGGRAEDLPFAAASFDTAVSAFALCTVSDPAAALS